MPNPEAPLLEAGLPAQIVRALANIVKMSKEDVETREGLFGMSCCILSKATSKNGRLIPIEEALEAGL